MADAPIAYLGSTADDAFELPRWQDSSNYQMYGDMHNQQPPQNTYRQPQPPQPPQQAPTYAEHDRLPTTMPATGALSRSTSISAAASATLRAHRTQPDDLEKAYSAEPSIDQRHARAQQPQAPQQVANPFYPSSVAYHQQSPAPPSAMQSPPAAQPATDPYTDYMYGAPPPRRSYTDSGARSPHRTTAMAQAPALQTTDMYGVPSQSTPSAATPMYTSQSYPGATVYATAGPPPAAVKQETWASPTVKAETPSGWPASNTAKEPSSPYMPPPAAISPGPRPFGAYPDGTASATVGGGLSASHTPRTVSPLSPYAFGAGGEPMAGVDPPPPARRRTRSPGFKRVRDSRDLRPFVSTQPLGRRIDPLGTGSFLSPLRSLTTHIATTYHICNPAFHYETSHNPRRVLTKPSKPAHNEGFDNEDYDYILYVNDWLGTDETNKYLILDVLGQGTFGQVVKCQNMKTHEVVAVKVVKNKPAYFNQSMMEVTVLELLNKQCDPDDQHHILRLRDSFIHRNHLCLVFELLSSNLYELIKQNSFQGLSTQLVKVFTAQLLDALTILKDARLIHCDLKPENILLKSLQSPQIKVIDFGSACHERQTVYTYIQSRFYRSPEVLLGCSYTAAIDMWSLACIAVELFLGLPLFPGVSEYNQVSRIVEMLGLPPSHIIERGKQAGQFFEVVGLDEYGKNAYRLKSIEQYSREHNTQEQPGKKYFSYSTLPDIIKNAPLPPARQSGRQAAEMEKEMNNRMAFIDFCQGLLHLDPTKRWTPQQARLHPFITGEKFTRPFTIESMTIPPSLGAPAQKHQYGGLVPVQQKQGTRAYQDAASYNQQLAQHQAYTAAHAQASQASTQFRNPYVGPQDYPQQQQQQVAQQAAYAQSAQQVQQQQQAQQQPGAHRTLAHQSSNGALRTLNQAMYPPAGGNPAIAVAAPPNNPHPPANSYYPNSRTRANTLGQMDASGRGQSLAAQMDAVPPALARLSNMNALEIPGGGGRNALTPVMNRDDAMREWERRQAAKQQQQHATAYPPALEYLQQQAELATAGGLGGWPTHPPHAHAQGRYGPAQPSNLHYSSTATAPVVAVPTDDGRLREAVMTNVRSAAGRTDIANPPAAYGSATARYDATADVNALYVPMQSAPYNAFNSPTSPGSSRTAPQPPPPSLYGAAVVPTGTQQAARLPFANSQTSPQAQAQSAALPNPKRMSQMDWPR